MLIDTHCHIDAERFDDDRPAVLRRAREAGLVAMVTIGCDEESSRRVLGLAATHDDVYASVGVHPHEANAASERFDEVLEALSSHPRCVAIGECGLDSYYDHSPREVQREVFARQIALARRVQKPIVVHVRDAYDDCLDILRSEGAAEAGGVIHCFSGDWAFGSACLDLGFYLSIPGIVTFKNPGALPEVVRKAPLERLLIETDAPYLAPAPHRGKRNEPSYVRLVAEKVAELRGASLDEVYAQTTENARRLLAIPR